MHKTYLIKYSLGFFMLPGTLDISFSRLRLFPVIFNGRIWICTAIRRLYTKKTSRSLWSTSVGCEANSKYVWKYVGQKMRKNAVLFPRFSCWKYISHPYNIVHYTGQKRRVAGLRKSFQSKSANFLCHGHILLNQSFFSRGPGAPLYLGKTGKTVVLP